MKATLVFDTVNDLLYHKWDETFLERMKSFIDQDHENNVGDSNGVSQLLAPIITSQRVMAAQFGNTYSSMQCKDGTTIVFDEWLDHVFVIISEDNVDDAHRELLDCKTLVQHICGQNINLLQSPIYREWLSTLLDCRTKGDSTPGANGVIGESGATAAALGALKAASKDIKLPYSHYHLMLFVGDKMLALYSSRGCEDMAPPDLIMLSIECIAAQEYWQEARSDDSNTQSEIIRLPWLSQENSAVVNLCAGSSNAPCAPHSLHLAELAPRITFAIIVDMDLREVGVATYMSSQILSNLRRLLLQRNLELLPNTLDTLEAALKKTTDALRKNKSNTSLCARITTRMLELRKSCTTTTPLTPETTATAMHTALEAAIEQLKPDIPSLRMELPLRDLRGILAPYVEFLKVKAMRFFSMGSLGSEVGSLTVHKYVEEFPGLVHFVYVDRSAGRSLAPDIADCADMLTRDTVRHLISRSFAITREGYCAATWRRGALHVCSVSWWERRGAPVRPAKPPHPAAVRALAPPGDILGTFYRYEVIKSSADVHERHRYDGQFVGAEVSSSWPSQFPGTYSALSTGTKSSVHVHGSTITMGNLSAQRSVLDGPRSSRGHTRHFLQAVYVSLMSRREAPMSRPLSQPRRQNTYASYNRQLVELAFPNESQGVSMKELICVHLGLLPASTAVQQARRLAHSVHEIAGDHLPAAADLL